MVGEESVANQLDTVGAAVHGGTGEFERFYFTFAPLFGPVWDPV